MDDLLQQIAHEVEKCILCGACQAVCPVYYENMDETQVARGRMALLNAILKEELRLTDRLDEILATCIGCSACSAHCPSGTAGDLANLAAKLDIGKKKGIRLYQKLLSRQLFSKPGMLSVSTQLLNIMGNKIYTPLSGVQSLHPALPYIRDGIPRNIPPLKGTPFHKRGRSILQQGKFLGKVALFYGCAIDRFYPEWGDSAVRILNRSGYEVIFPEEPICCGAPVLFMGDLITAEKLMKKNLAALEEPDLDGIITLCATCGHTLRELYPKFLQREETELFSSKVVDLQEFLVTRNLWKEPEAGDPGLPTVRITYHDPCHLNRGMGVHEAPRNILKSLPGIDFIEMKDADRCCGGGGLFSLSHYDLSLKIGQHKVERICETGAEIVATACPSCTIHLTDLLRRQNLDIRAVHVCELLNRALYTTESVNISKELNL
jgi:glycolate oxidase iron-sulfur subunit